MMIVKVIGQGENGKVLVETEYGRMTANWEGTLPTFGMECPVEISLDNVSITNVSEFGPEGIYIKDGKTYINGLAESEDEDLVTYIRIGNRFTSIRIRPKRSF